MVNTAPTPPLSALEFALLNRFQREFPVVPRPFAALAQQLDSTEANVITQLQALQRGGWVSRVGAVFRPNAIGASTLAALAVPADRLEQVSAQISAIAQVNHNYEREHHFNLWFVVAAASATQLRAVLQHIETISQCGPVLVLPLVEDFHIDLGFDLTARADQLFSFGDAPPAASTVPQLPLPAAIALTEPEQILVAALQQGLPLVERPFAALGLPEAQATDIIARWLATGTIKRLGVVVRHHELGYRANAMAVWDVPDSLVGALGHAIARTGRVTLCYRRDRQLPHWPYNLFCMIHGKDRADVEARIAALIALCQMQALPHTVLFSRTRYKQCGAQYAAPAELAHG